MTSSEYTPASSEALTEGIYHWRVKAIDEIGNETTWTDSWTFTVAPQQPTNISPGNGETGVSCTPLLLRSSDFYDPIVGHSHAASQWQVLENFGSSYSIIYDSFTDASHLTQMTFSADLLIGNRTYYWRVRYQNNYGNWSDWSTETSFIALNRAPHQPTESSPGNGATGVSLTPTLQCTGFYDPDSGDPHAASQWQLRTASGSYSAPAFDSGTDTTNLTQITLPGDILDESTTYYWHVRHQDSHEAWSDWSVESSFTTAANLPPNQPSNASPTNGATGIALMPTLRSSGLSDPNNGDTHAASQWQITTIPGSYITPVFDSETDTANLTTIIVPSGELAKSTTYYWRVRYQDSHGAWSEWSAETSFRTCTSQPPPDGSDSESGTSVGDLTDIAGVECWAVIVGVSDYQNFGPAPFILSPRLNYDLDYSDDSAEQLYEVLSSAWGESHTRLLVDADATKTAIGEAIVDWLAPREDANDIVLFFFSGHGLANWLAPYDSLNTSYANDISSATLNSWLGSLDSSRIVIALDACESGAYGSHLSNTGRVVLTSCTSTESSWETSVLKHGVFSNYLLSCFTDKTSDEAHYAADANRDHIISAEEIFDYLEPNVLDWANQNSEDQHPQLYDGCSGQLGLVTYRTRYYLAVESKYGVAQGEGWYDEGSTAAFSVSGGATWYRSFGGWSSDSNGDGRSSTVVMDGTKTISATWKTSWAVWALGIGAGIVLVVLLLVVVLRAMRRRQPVIAAPVPASMPTVAGNTALCPRCGTHAKPQAMYCHKCGVFLSKPAGGSSLDGGESR